MTDSTPPRGDSATSDARGADLLLSLSSERTSHVKTLETPNGKGFYPLSKQVTPSELDRNGRGPMLMSIHSSGYHRILPSPIKLENHSLVYSTGSESSSPTSVEKREADSPPSDGERRLKQQRTDDDSEHSQQNHHHHAREEGNDREIEETGSSLISPSSSDEGKKAEVPTPGPPPGSAHPAYYGHHSSLPPHYSYPPHHQYPHGHHPSWGNPHHVPPSHMPPYYYPHPPPHAQYYAMIPRSPPPGYPPHGGIPPHHAPHAAKKPASVGSYLKDSATKDTSMSSKHAEAQAEAIKSISDWQKGVSGGPRTYARCVPLQHPIPSRYWG